MSTPPIVITLPGESPIQVSFPSPVEYQMAAPEEPLVLHSLTEGLGSHIPHQGITDEHVHFISQNKVLGLLETLADLLLETANNQQALLDHQLEEGLGLHVPAEGLPVAQVVGLGSAATAARLEFATAAQGQLADTALQPGAVQVEDVVGLGEFIQSTIAALNTQEGWGVGSGGGNQYPPVGLDSYEVLSNFSSYPNFQLSAIPEAPHLLQLFVSTIKQTHGVDFVVNGSVLTWTGDFQLASNYLIEVYY